MSERSAPGSVQGRLGMHPVEWAVTRLDNGLRAVVCPRPGNGAVSVAVAYGVGFRDERPGQSGFAHLFEHLMAQGSLHLERGEHKQLVEDSGGMYGAETRGDYTVYQSLVPATELDLALWCEAERMRGPRLTEENLANEVAVVEQEIRGNILSQPYGAFPWFPVDATLFSRFASKHDGYGTFADLERATVQDAVAFFDTFYGPGNAVVAVAGDVEPEYTLQLVERHFGGIAARPAPPVREVDEPVPDTERRARLVDDLAPHPALALGWRVPDPKRQTETYLQFKLLNHVLTDGPGSWWSRQLTEEKQLARSVVGWLGSLGSWAGTAHPAQYAAGFHPIPGVEVDTLLAGVDRATEALAERLGDDQVRSTAAVALSNFQRRIAVNQNRAVSGAVCQLLYDTPMLGDLQAVWSATTAVQLRELAAHWLLTDGRAVVEIVPTGVSR